jgi:leader peptidase (prepilin peptidase)/N-methyltransferase
LSLEAVSLVTFAPIIGSFLGVVVHRLPAGRPVVWARSRCDACHVILGGRDLLPVVSWLAARGRCRRCGNPLGWFYPAIEIAALAVALIALAVDGLPFAWLDSFLGWWLLTLGWIDLRNWVLPDVLTLPLIVAGLATAAWFDPASLTDRAAGAALGYLLLRGVAAVYRRLRGRDGLGGGDAKLLAASGAWLGIIGVPQVIFGAALLGLAAAAVARLGGTGLRPHSAIPFGPFIAFVTWILWLYGPLTL